MYQATPEEIQDLTRRDASEDHIREGEGGNDVKQTEGVGHHRPHINRLERHNALQSVRHRAEQVPRVDPIVQGRGQRHGRGADQRGHQHLTQGLRVVTIRRPVTPRRVQGQGRIDPHRATKIGQAKRDKEPLQGNVR